MGLRLWGFLENPGYLSGFCGFGAVGEAGRVLRDLSVPLSPKSTPPKLQGCPMGPFAPLAPIVWYAPETQDAVLTHVAL